jgi:hypothetical protein
MSGIQKDSGKWIGTSFSVFQSTASPSVIIKIEIKTGKHTEPHQGSRIKNNKSGSKELFVQPMNTFNQR